MPKIVETVDNMERRRKHGFIASVAKIIGQEAAQKLASDIHNAPPEAQQLTAYERSLLDRAGNRNAYRR